MLARADVLFEQVGIEELWVAVVHDFVEELVEEGKVLPHRALIELTFEVGAGHLDKPMEEVQGQCGIDIALGAPEESNIVVSRVDKAHARKLDDGCLFRGFRSNNLVAKVQYFISTKKVKKSRHKIIEESISQEC